MLFGFKANVLSWVVLLYFASVATSQAQQNFLQNCKGYAGLYQICEGDGPYSIRTPNVIFALSESLAAQRRNLELDLQFAADTVNLQLYRQVQSQLNSSERAVKEAIIQGLLALIGAQNGNFAALQELLQARSPNREVSVSPYTDGTIDIAVNGENHTHKTIDVLRGLFQEYANSDGTPRFY